MKPQLRIRLNSTRYRVPDILLLRHTQRSEPVLTSPPLLCIEIVSPEDRMSRVTEQVEDYLSFGVDYVWAIDPKTETAWQHEPGKSVQVRDHLSTSDPDLTISLAYLFSRLSKYRKLSG